MTWGRAACALRAAIAFDSKAFTLREKRGRGSSRSCAIHDPTALGPSKPQAPLSQPVNERGALDFRGATAVGSREAKLRQDPRPRSWPSRKARLHSHLLQ